MVQPGSEALRAAIGKGDELFLHGVYNSSSCFPLLSCTACVSCVLIVSVLSAFLHTHTHTHTHTPVSNPREAALDSEFLAMCSQYAAEQANRLSTQMKTYDVPTYIHRLSLFLRGKLVVNNAGLAEAIDEDEATLKRAGKRRRTEENGDEEGEEEEHAEDIDDDAQTLRWPELGALVAGFAQSTPSLDCLYETQALPALLEASPCVASAAHDRLSIHHAGLERWWLHHPRRRRCEHSEPRRTSLRRRLNPRRYALSS
jgi:hypothetical protein